MNLALVYRALFGKDHQPRHLDDALEAVDGALDEFRKAGAAFYLEKAERLRAQILALKGSFLRERQEISRRNVRLELKHLRPAAFGAIMAPTWSRIGAVLMPVNLSIKDAPDEIVRRLRERASRHHRSLQGELLAILEASVRFEEQLSTDNLLAEVQRLGLRTPSESAAMIRTDRDAR